MFRYSLLMLSVLGVIGAALSLFRFEWATTLGLDVWNLPSLERDEESAQQLSESLSDRSEILMERIRAKGRVANDLVARRLTLLEAAAQFRHLNHEPPQAPAAGLDCFPGRTENERLCRQVLSWVPGVMEGCAPTQIEELVCGLEAELDAYLASHGDEVVLPEY